MMNGMHYGTTYGLHAERVSDNAGSTTFNIGASSMSSGPTFEHWMEDWKDRSEDPAHAAELVEAKVGGGIADLPDFVPVEDPLWRLHFPR